MKKMRLACIILGVLLLVGTMSGVAMAQMSKESIKCETLWWYDNEHYYPQQKEFCGMYMCEGLHTFKTEAECEEALRNSIPDYENFPYLYQYSIDRDKDGEVELVTKSYIRKIERKDLTDKLFIVTTKDIITVEEAPASKIKLLVWIPEISITVDKTTGTPDLKSIDPEYIRSITRYAIEENGKWRFIDEQTHIAKEKELMKSLGFTDEEMEGLRKRTNNL